jgi:6-phosphogluconolactonase
LEFTVLATAEEVAAAAANQIAEALRGGARTLVLTGGTTPQRSYELLAELDLEWGRVTVLFGDERCVPPDHPDSNYLMAKKTLLDRVFPATVHRMPGELGPDEGAAEYEKVVAANLPLDFVLLGVGEDGHTASLFPGHQALKAHNLVVGIDDSPKPPPERITLSLPVLRAARRCVLLATGAEKAGALAAMLGEPSRHVPASLLERERLTVIADDAAAPEAAPP